MGECQGLPNPLVRHSGRRIPERRSPDSIRSPAMAHPSARRTQWPNSDRSWWGNPLRSAERCSPIRPGLKPTGQRRICRSAHRWHRPCEILLFPNPQSAQRLNPALPRPAADPIELCEVFATEVVDRSGWGGLYRVHRRRRWRRGGPDGPLRTGSGQIVLTGSVLRRHRHHLSRAALQRPSSGYDRTCPDVPPPI